MSPELGDNAVSIHKVTGLEKVREIVRPGNVEMSPEEWEGVLKLIAESGAIIEATGTDGQLEKFEKETEGELVRISPRVKPSTSSSSPALGSGG